MIQLTIRPLSAARVIQAFPLIQTALPEVTLAAWRDFAAALISGTDARGDARRDTMAHQGTPRRPLAGEG